jgi:hypothetical protein
MSAFVVSTSHVNALIRNLEVHDRPLFDALGRSLLGVTNGDTARIGTGMGKALLRENVRSVNWRYLERGRAPRFVYAPAGDVPSDIAAVKLADCLDYQSCEHPGWVKSKAYRLLVNLRESALRRVAGLDHRGSAAQGVYNAASWSI